MTGLDKKLQDIADTYEHTYVYLFGEGGTMEGTITDDDAKQRAVATILIQYYKTAGNSSYAGNNAHTPLPVSEELCPQCKNAIKSGVNKLGKPYKKCDVCRVWVGANGKLTPMVN